jgi:TDG/mug DNA glycosylase family protein
VTKPWKPTKEQLLAATNKTVRDVIAPDLRVLFCGINPGLYTAAVGHHFARPGNRFWPALFAGGFTDRLLSPFDERELLKSGFGITNMVRRNYGHRPICSARKRCGKVENDLLRRFFAIAPRFWRFLA